VLRAILEHLEALYPQVGASSQALYQAWSARLAMLGEPIVVRTAEGDQTGLLEGVTPDGALLLKQASGQTLKLLAGDVRLRPAR
jgi:BirA family biotin operon repressor/biotin-[acetyl-CoA-carboxylase] ligase